MANSTNNPSANPAKSELIEIVGGLVKFIVLITMVVIHISMYGWIAAIIYAIIIAAFLVCFWVNEP